MKSCSAPIMTRAACSRRPKQRNVLKERTALITTSARFMKDGGIAALTLRRKSGFFAPCSWGESDVFLRLIIAVHAWRGFFAASGSRGGLPWVAWDSSVGFGALAAMFERTVGSVHVLAAVIGNRRSTVSFGNFLAARPFRTCQQSAPLCPSALGLHELTTSSPCAAQHIES